GRVGNDLGYLPARSRACGPEVRQAGRPARLSWASARVSTHVASHAKALDEVVEGGSGRHILEELIAGIVVEADGVRDHLGKLASGDLVAGLERTVGVA